ncbi:MAG: OB-fold nucleic acid binding domain-containing protein, partial [Patescibacteria group bacterium]|nr:OB-fold nucleic acid binding domain-containing protein [Patescibacteria group bacterium]
MQLNTPLSGLTGIGPTLAKKLVRLNLFTVEDLVNHYPFRYDDFSNSADISQVKIGEKVTLKGEIWDIKNTYTRFRKVLTRAILNDSSGTVELIWFNQPWLIKNLHAGDRLQVSGKVSRSGNKITLTAPQWEKITNDSEDRKTHEETIHTGRLVPIYPETYGLTSKWIRQKIAKILPLVISQINDPLPNTIRGEMLPLKEAVDEIHFPTNWQKLKQAKERLAFDELFYIQLSSQKTRLKWRQKKVIDPLQIDPKTLGNFIQKLPFELTQAQKKVVEEIVGDLKKTHPMNRLVQGDVGSGKTVVAATIIYLTHLAGFKSLLMAPTEILAFQHFETLSKLLSPFGIEVGIYTGSKKFNSTKNVTASEARQSQTEIASPTTPDRNDNLSNPNIVI